MTVSVRTFRTLKYNNLKKDCFSFAKFPIPLVILIVCQNIIQKTLTLLELRINVRYNYLREVGYET